MRKQVIYDFALPIIMLVSLTAIGSAIGLDLEVSKHFFSPERGWFLTRDALWTWLYDYGPLPCFVTVAASLCFLLGSLLRRRFGRGERIALFLIVLSLLGPGLIVNLVFKDHWGRPRPLQIEDFGGDRVYHPVWRTGVSGEGRSFPSGHASSGFFLFAPFFFLRQGHKGWARFFLVVGIGYGGLMGAGRIVQGGHFISDVLWSGGLVYLTGLALSYAFGFDARIPARAVAPLAGFP